MEDLQHITSASVAQALARDYFSIYYINVENDRFVEYSSTKDYEELGIEKSGDDFFNLSRTNILRIIHPDDKEMFLERFTKEKILVTLFMQPTFTMTYRLILNNVPVYVHMKATRMKDQNDNHIVIGVSNIDEQMRAQEAYEKAHTASLTYSHIAQALAGDYFSIYAVDPETDTFTEFSSTSDYDALGIEKSGEDFFNLSRTNIQRIIYPEDRDLVLALFTKENLMHELGENGIFTIKYRLMFGDEPTYVSMKATLMDDSGGRHLIIGVNNIDAQMRREFEYTHTLNEAKEKAYRDQLTGVKSKHAFSESEENLNAEITAGTVGGFAVTICDINGLKAVNDTQGHKAGDAFIKNACMIICKIFDHSPVFRIGGDEFAVISQGSDYEMIDTLIEKMETRNCEAKQNGDVIIACGMSRFDPDCDQSVSAVFERADERMYANKKRLKGIEDSFAERRGEDD